MVLPLFVCIYCKYFEGTERWDWNNKPTCKAFKPQQIPDKILAMEDKHLHPIEGDHGLMFEPSPDYAGMREEFLKAESEKLEDGVIVID